MDSSEFYELLLNLTKAEHLAQDMETKRKIRERIDEMVKVYASEQGRELSDD